MSTPRSIETQIEINAPVEAVWKALTDAAELANWFPVKARVKPGVGGHVWSYWADDQQWESPIDVWDEGKHLRVVWARVGKHGDFECPFEIAVDYYIETRGGTTVLRLVHSGFSTDASWDSQYDGTKRGWNFELRSLKHYLERHLGTPRAVVSARCKIDGTLEEAWSRLTGPDGLTAEGTLANKRPGDRIAITTANGTRLEGPIQIISPPQDLAAMVENLNDAYLRVRIDLGCHTLPTPEVHLWLSTYGLEDGLVSTLQASFDALLTNLFAGAATS